MSVTQSVSQSVTPCVCKRQYIRISAGKTRQAFDDGENPISNHPLEHFRYPLKIRTCESTFCCESCDVTKMTSTLQLLSSTSSWQRKLSFPSNRTSEKDQKASKFYGSSNSCPGACPQNSPQNDFRAKLSYHSQLIRFTRNIIFLCDLPAPTSSDIPIHQVDISFHAMNIQPMPCEAEPF